MEKIELGIIAVIKLFRIITDAGLVDAKCACELFLDTYTVDRTITNLTTLGKLVHFANALNSGQFWIDGGVLYTGKPMPITKDNIGIFCQPPNE